MKATIGRCLHIPRQGRSLLVVPALLVVSAMIWGCLVLAPYVECPLETYAVASLGNRAAAPQAKPPDTDLWNVRWGDLHDAYVQRAARGGVDLLFLGDSITYRWMYEGFPVWLANYSAMRAAAFGISGDRVENVLWRIQNGELDGIEPRAIVLMIGTNNLGRDTPSEIAEGIGVLLTEIRRRVPRSRVVLVGLLPRNDNEQRVTDPRTFEVNDRLREFADCAVRFVDIAALYLASDGQVRRDLLPDGLHPNAGGYAVYAQAIRPVLEAP